MSTPGPGGRRIRHPQQATPAGPVVRGMPLLAVVVAAALLCIAAVRSPSVQTPGAPAPTTGSRETLLTSVATSCPALSDGRTTADGESVGVASLAVAGAASSGRRTAAVLPSARDVPALRQDAAGPWATARPRGSWRAVVLRSTGGLAPGSTAFTSVQAPKVLGGGRAVGSCPRPTRDTWFVGAGNSAEHQTSLVLTNTADAPAVVALTLAGPKGPVEAVGGSAIALERRSVTVVAVDDLAAGETELSIHAVVRRGSASVAAVDSLRRGTTPAGSEWLPAASAPTTEVTVAAVPTTKADRTLLVANPGDRTATVRITVAGPGGRFTPTGLEEISVRPHAIGSVAIGPGVEDAAFALSLDSDEPVTAAVRIASQGSSADTAYAVGAPASTQSAVMPLELPGSRLARDATLVLTSGATSSDATATVTAVDADGTSAGSVEVTVPAGRTVTVDPAAERALAPVGGIAYLRVDPGGDPLVATAVYAGADGISVVPLGAAPTRVAAPVARPAS